MNKLNAFLTVLMIYLIGLTSGLFISKYTYGYDEDSMTSTLLESYNLVDLSKTEIQKQFLHFYMNNYCDHDSSRIINIDMTGLIWNGVYCDKDNVLILSDSHLPIAVLEIYTNTGE